MIYSVRDYFLPTIGLLIFSIIIVTLVYINICRHIKSKKDPLLTKKLPLLYLSTMMFIVLVAIYSIPSVVKWAYLSDASSKDVTVGTVASIRSAVATPIYYDRANCSFSTPSFVTISGVD